jgi:hypothetical protein
MSEEPQLSVIEKRQLILFGLGVALLILLAAVLRGCLIALRTPSPTADLVEIGHVDDFPPGSIHAIELPVSFEPPPFVTENLDVPPNLTTPMPALINPLPLFVVYDEQAGLLVFYRNSPLSGCMVAWEESNERFTDPCYGDKFTRTGAWIEGQAPRGLDRFAVQIDDGGAVYVDASMLIQGTPLPTPTAIFTPVRTLTPSETPQGTPTPTTEPLSLEGFLNNLQEALNESDLEALEAYIRPVFVTGIYPVGTSTAVSSEVMAFLEWRLLPRREDVSFQEVDNASLPAELTAETLFNDKAAHITVVESSGWGPDSRIKGLFYILEQAGTFQWVGLVLTSGEFAPLPDLETIPLPAGLVYHDRFDWRLVGINGEETVLIHHNPRLTLNPSATLALEAEHGEQSVTLFHLPGGDGQTIELDARLMTDAWRIPWLDDQTAVLAVTHDSGVYQATIGQLALLHTATGQLTLLDIEVDSYVQPSVTAAVTIVYGMDGPGRLLAWRDGQAASLPVAGLGGDISSLSRVVLSPDETLLAGITSRQDTHPAAYAVVGMAQPVGVRIHPYSSIGTDAVLPTGITWSPDSRWLALLPPASDIVVSGVWLAAADGSAKVHLGAGTRNPVWLDANRIVYSATVLGVDGLQLYDLTTGEASWLDTSRYDATPLDGFWLDLPPNIHPVQIIEDVE